MEAEPILDEFNNEMTAIKGRWAQELRRRTEKPSEPAVYSEEAKNRETVIVWGETMKKLAYHYTTPSLLFIGGCVCVVASYKIEHARYLSAVAFSAATEKAFKAYRQRVISEHGAQADYDYFNGIHRTPATATITNEDGTTETVESEVISNAAVSAADMYTFLFSEETSDKFDPRTPAGNKSLILSEISILNRRGRCKGFIFLNDVLAALGMSPVKEGYRAGWYFGPDSTGDREIHVRFINPDFENCIPINGRSQDTLLVFNCDGDVMKIVEERGLWQSIFQKRPSNSPIGTVA